MNLMPRRLLAILVTALLFFSSADRVSAQDDSIVNYIKKYPLFEYITIKMDQKRWNLTFVGHNYRVSLDYVPPVLETLKNSKLKMDSRVVPHYNAMFDAAKADGVPLVPLSAYRSIQQQMSGFNRRVHIRVTQEGLEEEETVRRLAGGMAYPGASEHNLGLSVDFRTEGQEGASRLFERTEQFAWLMAHAADYGFILRYPKDKKSITGYNYEPWHWRYVGVEVAKELKEKGITFEEYLGRRFLSPNEAQELKTKGISIRKYLRKQAK